MPPLQIFFKVVLTTDKEDKYRQVTNSLEVANRKPPNRVNVYENSIVYTMYHENHKAALRQTECLLAKIEEYEQKRIKGA
jgi:hypothetical protein